MMCEPEDTRSASERNALCVDCGTPTALALVDADALEVVWLCPGCLTARYSTTLGHGRHLEEGAP